MLIFYEIKKPDYIEKVKMTEAESRGGHVVKDANGKCDRD